MPMGVCSALEAFQQFMHSILGHLDFVLIYMDDVLIISDTVDQHLEHIKTVFRIMAANNVTLNKSKCSFLKTEIKYLGFILGPTGLLPDPRKVEVILEAPQPRSKKQLRGFIEMVQFFRRFIPNAASIMSPLLAMTSKKVEFLFDDKMSDAFLKVKQLLAKNTLLYYPDFQLPFYIMADASNYGIGSVVYQINKDNVPCPVHFYSQKLSDTAIRRSIVEKEALSIISVLDHLRPMLFGQTINVYCDNLNVVNLHNTKTAMLQRCASRIQEYSPNISSKIEGVNNPVADCLSRYYDSDIPQISSISDFPLSLEHIAKQQRQDPNMIRLFNHLSGQTTILTPKELRTLEFIKLKEMDHTKLLTHMDKIIIPATLTQAVLEWVHLNYSHPGITRMVNTLQTKFFWKTLLKDVKKYCKSCLVCAKGKINTKQYGKLTATTVQSTLRPFGVIAIDLQGPFPVNISKTGEDYKYLLTIIDIHSRWVELIPLSSQKSVDIAQEVNEWWFCRYPRPRVLLSDQGPNLKGKPFAELLNSYGVQHHFTTTYMATANSIVERLHGTINQIIRCLGVNSWLDNIQTIAFSLRASVHQSTKMAPSDIVFGMDLLLPALNSNKDLLPKYVPKPTQVEKDLERKNRNRIAHDYKANDLVLIRKTPIK